MSRSTNAINLLGKAGIVAKRSSEAVSVLPETLRLITDETDDLYCPGVDASPDPSLLAGMRNGWMEGSAIVCVNRGTKADPIPFVVAGRSRQKSAVAINVERAAEGLEPMRVDIVFCSEADAYNVMILENNKQERGPLFNPLRWSQHKRVVARRLGKATLSDDEKAEARREFASLIGCTEGAIVMWETMLENPPEVLSLVGTGMISQKDATELVREIPVAERAEKARELVIENENAKRTGETKRAVRERVLGNRRHFTPKQIRLLTVGAAKLGIDDKQPSDYEDREELLRDALADGFALFGKLVTQEIGIPDLPPHLADMAMNVLNKSK